MGFIKDLGRGVSRALRKGTGQPTDLQAAASVFAGILLTQKERERLREELRSLAFCVDLAATISADRRVATAKQWVAGAAEALK